MNQRTRCTPTRSISGSQFGRSYWVSPPANVCLGAMTAASAMPAVTEQDEIATTLQLLKGARSSCRALGKSWKNSPRLGLHRVGRRTPRARRSVESVVAELTRANDVADRAAALDFFREALYELLAPTSIAPRSSRPAGRHGLLEVVAGITGSSFDFAACEVEADVPKRDPRDAHRRRRGRRRRASAARATESRAPRAAAARPARDRR